MVKLHAITESGHRQAYEEVKQKLLERFMVKSITEIRRVDVVENHQIQNRHATNIHTGKLKDGVQLSELELAMVLDGGYSFFGGSSSISPDGKFRVEIWTD